MNKSVCVLLECVTFGMLIKFESRHIAIFCLVTLLLRGILKDYFEWRKRERSQTILILLRKVRFSKFNLILIFDCIRNKLNIKNVGQIEY